VNTIILYQFQPILKESVISLLLKKSTLDKDELSSYRPISNLSFISIIIECIVKSRVVNIEVSSIADKLSPILFQC